MKAEKVLFYLILFTNIHLFLTSWKDEVLRETHEAHKIFESEIFKKKTKISFKKFTTVKGLLNTL